MSSDCLPEKIATNFAPDFDASVLNYLKQAHWRFGYKKNNAKWKDRKILGNVLHLLLDTGRLSYFFLSLVSLEL
jgi:hypothetical protein